MGYSIAGKALRIIDEIVRETFADVEIERTHISPKKLSYEIYEFGDKTFSTDLTFTAWTKTVIRAEYKHPTNTREDDIQTIEILPRVKSERKLEDFLRKELDDFLGVILRRIKLKQTVRQFIKQKLHPKGDVYPSLIFDDGLHARVKVHVPFLVELLISYEWDKNKKTVSDISVVSIEVTMVDEKIEELIFNAILSYYLLS